VISISITAEAHKAIKATLPEAADSWPVQTDDRGLIRLWLDRPFVDRLAQMRGPGETYSDVILRLATVMAAVAVPSGTCRLNRSVD
jgi:hypothetical protein